MSVGSVLGLRLGLGLGSGLGSGLGPGLESGLGPGPPRVSPAASRAAAAPPTACRARRHPAAPPGVHTVAAWCYTVAAWCKHGCSLVYTRLQTGSAGSLQPQLCLALPRALLSLAPPTTATLTTHTTLTTPPPAAAHAHPRAALRREAAGRRVPARYPVVGE